MDTQLNKEKIQALSVYRQLEKEFGESTLESLADDLIHEWQTFGKHGNFYANIKRRAKDTYVMYASRAFSEIQHKKLFNLECKWRAGKVKLNIVSSHVFHYYNTLIHECPFIEPVTEAEIATYKEYLFEHNDFPKNINANLDHAKMVMAALNNTSEYSKWYKFFDHKFNTRDLLFLDDLVYEHELRCLQKHFKKYKSVSSGGMKKVAEEFRAIMNAFKTGDFSNVIVTTNEKFLELAHILNDKKYAAQLQAKIEDEQTLPEANAELAYNYLDSLLFDIPAIKQDYTDWKDGIYETASEHLKMEIIKHLDEVYEDYKTGKLNNYTEEERKKAKEELDYWQDAYLDGKKKLELE